MMVLLDEGRLEDRSSGQTRDRLPPSSLLQLFASLSRPHNYPGVVLEPLQDAIVLQ